MKRLKTLAVWILFVGGLITLTTINTAATPPFRHFAAFRQDITAGRVGQVRIQDNKVTVELRDGDKYYTLGVVDDPLTARLSERGVQIEHGEEKGMLEGKLPILLLIFVVATIVFFLFRRNSGGTPGGILSLRKSLARSIPEVTKAKFADVGGCDEAKQLLGDVIDFLKNPDRWSQADVRLPRGVLLEGPPGCGKTLLARAVAGETNAHFYLVSASEFVEMFVGVGAARVRNTFEVARKHAPAVIFIDELDAVGRRRGSGAGASHDEREQTLNQLLVCLDGIESRVPVAVIAATNRADILDPALLRPGRFDRRVRIPLLSRDARLDTLRIHARKKPLATDVSLDALADRTDGFSGAQIEHLVNEAALLAVRRTRDTNVDRVEVRAGDFDRAMQLATSSSRHFNTLDAVLVESVTQLAEPTGRAVVRVSLDGESIEGELMWANAHFLKIRGENGPTIVAKAQIGRIEALEGTEGANPLDLVADPWERSPDLA